MRQEFLNGRWKTAGYIRLTIHGRKEDAVQLLDWFRERGADVRMMRDGEAIVGKNRWIIQWGTAKGISFLRLETRKANAREVEMVSRTLFRVDPTTEVHYGRKIYRSAQQEALVEAVAGYIRAEWRKTWKQMVLLGLIGIGIVLVLTGYFMLLP